MAVPPMGLRSLMKRRSGRDSRFQSAMELEQEFRRAGIFAPAAEDGRGAAGHKPTPAQAGQAVARVGAL
jgi:hypothetical protein